MCNNVLSDLTSIKLTVVTSWVQDISILDIIKALRNKPTSITEFPRLLLTKHYSFIFKNNYTSESVLQRCIHGSLGNLSHIPMDPRSMLRKHWSMGFRHIDMTIN
jgi:hypothetical protein